MSTDKARETARIVQSHLDTLKNESVEFFTSSDEAIRNVEHIIAMHGVGDGYHCIVYLFTREHFKYGSVEAWLDTRDDSIYVRFNGHEAFCIYDNSDSVSDYWESYFISLD